MGSPNFLQSDLKINTIFQLGILMKKFLLIFFAMLIAGCTLPSDSNGAVNSDLTLRYGESKNLPGEDIRVTFEKVLEDSRCPVGVTCVWEGNAKIRLSLLELDIRSAGELNSNVKIDPDSLLLAGYMFRIKSLDPYPVDGVIIDSVNYEVTLTFKK